MTPDIRVKRGKMRTSVMSSSVKGKHWMMRNLKFDFEGEVFSVENEYAEELVLTMRKAGLEVEVL